MSSSRSTQKFRVALAFVAMVATVAPDAAHGQDAQPFKPILAETAGSGPGRQVTGFRVNPEVYELDARRKKTLVSARTLQALADGRIAADEARREEMGRVEGWTALGNILDATGSVSMAIEHGGGIDALGKINTVLTYAGLFMAVWQLNLDLSQGDWDKGAVNAYKGFLSFTLGRFGAPMVQASSLGLFAINYSLTTLGEAAWLARTDAWRQIYTAYYREADAAARAGELGPMHDYLQPTFEQRLAGIRGRVEGGRSVNEWKFLLAHYYAGARSPESFEAIVMSELDNYVSRFWRSPRFDEYVASHGRGRVDISRAVDVSAAIRTRLDEEHKSRLLAMFAEKVFPEIAHKAWVRSLEAEVKRLDAELRPELNSRLLLDISAYDLAAVTRFSMPLPAGGAWSGNLEPGKTRTIAMTRLAYILAGLPDTIALEGADGTAEQTFRFVEDKASVTFGMPQAQLITVYDRRESELACETVTRLKTGETRKSTGTRSPPGAGPVSFAVLPTHVLFGRYDGDAGWTLASPGTFEAGSGVMRLGSPRFEGLTALAQCSGGFLEGDTLADARCRAERHEIRLIDAGETETLCASTMTLSIKGAYMPHAEGGMQYFPLDGEQGRMLRNMLRDAMKHSEQAKRIQQGLTP